MQDDPRFSTWSIATFTAWLITILLCVAAWMTWLLGDEPWTAILIAETACVVSAVAAALQVRCYASQLAGLIRITAGLKRPDGDVREFGPRR